ncbi:right-handed parallel beta-helix repeat-containing protein [Maribacter polysiphoniae]|uniref:Right-handed parallel beta-helix repeat-containing protein n=1 Tax=Maribacter polysiphoniae TaxID=429344 RepID=A0ABR7W4W8_9FLAO|nr:right-handed parallel beta-helix repeat-containing protein [Maribacter polysiphoniae]
MQKFKRVILFFYLLFATSMVMGQETFLDNFSAVSYANNDGTQNWATNWTETGDTDNGPSSQYIRINSNRLEFYYIWSENIRRTVNLTGASSAFLTFDWQTISLGGSRALSIEISNDGGSSYTSIGTVSGGNSTGYFNQDISAYISANTTIRFSKSTNNWRNDDYAYLDNVQITATFPAPIPVLSINDVTANEDDGTMIFTVTHTGTDASGAFSANYNVVDGTATSGSDYNVTSGTLNFNGTSGDSETISVGLLDDGIIENTEAFTVQFTSVSDGSVDITDIGTGTINDDDALIMTDGSSVTTCNDTFLDPGGLNNYSNNQDVVYTICPDMANNYISVDFTNFDIDNGDLLYIYDGNSTGGTLIGQYNNNNVPSVIESEDSSGCLTFRFTSNGNTTSAGWIASVNCYPEGPKIIITDITFDETIGNAVFTVEQTRAAHGFTVPFFGFIPTSFTVDFQTVDGTALAGSDYTSVSGTLTFNGQIGNIQTISVPISNDGIPELAEDFTIEFTGATASYATINYSDTGRGTINSQILANDPLTLFKEFDGYYDYTTTGGSLRTNDNFTDACSITTSSSNTLISQIPGTATIEKAYLYWAHSSNVTDPVVTFEGQTVSANYIYQTTLTTRNFYGYVGDVTSIVKSVSNPSTNVFDFSDLTIDNTGDYCSTATVLGGWSLMVFYEDKSLPAVNINLYQGFDGLSNNGTSFTLDSFYAIAGLGAKASFLSWEGDSTLDGSSSGSTNPEELSITNQASNTYIQSGDGGQTGNNAYNSTIYDNTVSPIYNVSTTYGLDLDTYDISTYISPGDSQVTANVDVGQDFVISAAVVLKVPSNLIAGTVFEDYNYPGGVGRDEITSGGAGVSGAIVELFDSSDNFIQRKSTDIDGNYSFGGMADGTYSIKVVNSTVKSTRGGGLNCSACYPVQTYRVHGTVGSLVEVVNEIGGAYPANIQDVALGVINNAQSVSEVSVASNGVVGVNFGFNFNTIVNTNENGQGSLEQFIINSNALDETGLDIESNSIFDPVAGEDVSVFMIPPTGDALGRTADANYTGGIFSIDITSSDLSDITGNTTIIDARTQTAYSGDSNTGTVGASGTTVGVSSTALPNFELPEIQINKPDGEIFVNKGTDTEIRNFALVTDDKSAVLMEGGSLTVSNNFIGVNAAGINAGAIETGIWIKDGTTLIEGNYIATTVDNGVFLDGGTATTIRSNHFTNNGSAACKPSIEVKDGDAIVIETNLIENSGGLGIDAEKIKSPITIDQNSITTSGVMGGGCLAGILLGDDNAVITGNKIYGNAGAGIELKGNSTGNLISQNSFYANGTAGPALGIDLNQDGVSLNDNGDGDNGANGTLNFPIVSGAYISGVNLVVEGWARPGSTIEVFLTDINEGSAATGDNQMGLTTDYGEGQVFLASFVEGSVDDSDSRTAVYTDIDGNTDNTNKYKFTFPLPSGIAIGHFLTTTATLSNSTSEFSPMSVIKTYTVITNRRITYRVKSN